MYTYMYIYIRIVDLLMTYFMTVVGSSSPDLIKTALLQSKVLQLLVYQFCHHHPSLFIHVQYMYMYMYFLPCYRAV